MSTFAKLKLCFAGPSVKRMNDTVYKPNMFEGVGDQVLNYISWFCAIVKFFSPMLLIYATRRGLLYPETWRSVTAEQIRSLQNIIAIAAFTTTGAYLIRGVGRRFNGEYDSFLGKLLANDRIFLARSDFQFAYAPVEFAVPPRAEPSFIRTAVSEFVASPVKTLTEWPMRFLSYAFASTLGVRMLYPGCTGLFNSLTAAPRDEKRRELQLEHGGLRLALITERGNRVETMFVDRRNKTENGKTLVICHDGNAGYLEIGVAWTPLQLGYSVLSWNHPGFGGSDGQPFLQNEVASIDAVMQYAIQKAGFEPQNIVLLAWSIGGYTASYAAKLYPDVKCLVMDAVFDRLDELAVARMPPWMSGFVIRTVKGHVDLDNIANLKGYNGPVKFIRRTEDEIIATDDANKLQSNRINELVFTFLRSRYPAICDDDTMPAIVEFVYHGKAHTEAHSEQFTARMKQLNEMLEPLARRRVFPIDKQTLTNAGINVDDSKLKRELALFLARSHLTDFRANHNAPLANRLFTLPWSTIV